MVNKIAATEIAVATIVAAAVAVGVPVSVIMIGDVVTGDTATTIATDIVVPTAVNSYGLSNLFKKQTL